MFGERLKTMMVLKNVSRKELVLRLGIIYNSLSKKINRKRPFSYEELLLIREILKIDVEEYGLMLFAKMYKCSRYN